MARFLLNETPAAFPFAQLRSRKVHIPGKMQVSRYRRPILVGGIDEALVEFGLPEINGVGLNLLELDRIPQALDKDQSFELRVLRQQMFADFLGCRVPIGGSVP